MPDAQVWTLYPALGVVVALLIIIGGGVLKMWREYQPWLEKQDEKRDAERTKQRAWEEAQDTLRDNRWLDFVRARDMQLSKDNEADRATIANLALVIEGMRRAVEQLTLTLKSHIIEDDARFDVLLKPEQKSAIEDVKTQPRKKLNLE